MNKDFMRYVSLSCVVVCFACGLLLGWKICLNQEPKFKLYPDKTFIEIEANKTVRNSNEFFISGKLEGLRVLWIWGGTLIGVGPEINITSDPKTSKLLAVVLDGSGNVLYGKEVVVEFKK